MPIILDANAHSLFNSSEETLGDFRVQIATQPEFPQIGEKSQLLIRVTDTDYNEVDDFTTVSYTHLTLPTNREV